MNGLSFEKKLEFARKKTAEYNQEHLLQYFDLLDDNEKELLLDDILNIDFQFMCSLYKNANKEINAKNLDLKPAVGVPKSSMNQKELDEIYELGLAEISKGALCAVTMAGGQGSRLGHKGPKGTYDIGLPSHKSLFEIQCDGLKRISEKAKVAIPWYIMTSETNHEESVAFFEKNNYFGYPKKDIMFFKQSMIPVMDKQGRILLESPSKILKSPNGNGGLFSSLKDKSIFSDMRKRGIKWIFICGIDNVLVRMADPYFLGFTIKNKYKASAKSFLKRDASEKAGVFCYKDGRPYVIEYTEIPKELAELKDEKGDYVYGDTNVLNYIFDIDVAENIASAGLPYHTQIKAVTAYINGEYVESIKPDSYKFETFLFDSFNMLDDMGIFRIEREEEFAPVKNKTGIDSAESAREMYLAVYGAES
ncbi:MAG: UDPGP type 1 family protein [Clostridiaceae bacterium]|nr:UDPGP type 1 family protein [Clostridiaceae bacterium]